MGAKNWKSQDIQGILDVLDILNIHAGLLYPGNAAWLAPHVNAAAFTLKERNARRAGRAVSGGRRAKLFPGVAGHIS